MGDLVVDSVPGWLERAAIATLGTADKPVLLTGILVVSLLVGLGLGMLARRRFVLGAGGMVLVAVSGALAAADDPRASLPLAVLVFLVGAAVGVLVLRWLLGPARPRAVAHPAAEPVTAGRTGTAGAPVDRRRLLVAAGGTTAVALLAGVGGWLLSGREGLAAVRAAIRLPRPVRAAGPVPPGAGLEVPGLTPLFVPNEEFSRIDTALRVPVVDPATWRL